MTIYGFGCQNRSTLTDGGAWHKQSVSFSYGHQIRHLCPGDSGGPVFDDTHGQLVLLNSAYYNHGGDDIFAAPFAYYIEIWEAVHSLEASDATPLDQSTQRSHTKSTHTTPTSTGSPIEDICEDWGYYDDGHCDLECALPDPDCE